MKTINTRYKGFKITTGDMKWFIAQLGTSTPFLIRGDLALACSCIDAELSK